MFDKKLKECVENLNLGTKIIWCDGCREYNLNELEPVRFNLPESEYFEDGYAEIIINNPAVILIIHYLDSDKPDKKFIAKAHKEKFDPEKGLAICLLKYFDITYLGLKKLLKRAKVQKKKKETKKSKKKSVK